MGDKSSIEWTDATWNPIRGCSRVSEGCRNCYAEAVANRFCGTGQPYDGLIQVGEDGKGNGKWSGNIAFVEEHLLDPLRWKKPRRIFVNSMSDLFHPGVTDEMLDRIFAVMALCPQHTFQVLTKRPERMLTYLTSAPWGRIEETGIEIACDHWKSPCAAHIACDALDVDRIPLPNVWLGVSVEDQKTADERIPLVLHTPAAKRFISAEPLLGKADIWQYLGGGRNPIGRVYEGNGLDWVIVGGESGPGARPMHPDWARSLRDQCVAAGVPFFFKQWGEWSPVEYFGGEGHPLLKISVPSPEKAKKSTREIVFTVGGPGPNARSVNMLRVGKKASGRELDGREWNEVPL